MDEKEYFYIARILKHNDKFEYLIQINKENFCLFEGSDGFNLFIMKFETKNDVEQIFDKIEKDKDYEYQIVHKIIINEIIKRSK